MDSAAEIDTRQLRIVRRFKAPREMVFNAWTDSAMFARWFGPDRYHTTRCALDVREGDDEPDRLGGIGALRGSATRQSQTSQSTQCRASPHHRLRLVAARCLADHAASGNGRRRMAARRYFLIGAPSDQMWPKGSRSLA